MAELGKRVEKLQEETGEQSVAIGQLRAMVDGKQELIVSLEARNTALHVEIGKLGHFDVERADLAERVSDLLIGKARMHDVIDKQEEIIRTLRLTLLLVVAAPLTEFSISKEASGLTVLLRERLMLPVL